MPADINLVQKFQAGDHQAFATLVNQYQGYIASVAYSATGDISHSEDITQQTFLTAWQKQAELQDASKWLSWLRGITRNLLRNYFRSSTKKVTTSDRLDAIPGSDQEPLEQCISSEQSELLWSVLASIPEAYREPLVLFYREGQSVKSVAEMMGISDEAAKQRLARGRKLIKREIATFVEEALEGTRPSPALAATILASIPGFSATTLSTAATATTQGLAAKSTGTSLVAVFSSKLAMILLGPLIGIAGAFLGCRASLKAARSEEERKLLWRMILVVSAEVLLLFAIQLVGATWLRDWYFTVWLQVPLWTLHTTFLLVTIFVFNRRLKEINILLAKTDPKFEVNPAFELEPISTNSLRLNMLGTLIGSSCFLPICAAIVGDWMILAIWTLFLAGACGYLWSDASRQTTPGDQVRYNAKGMMLVIFPLAGLFMIRGDFWLQQIPNQPQIPAYLISIAILVFGLGLNLILQNRAAKCDEIGNSQKAS